MAVKPLILLVNDDGVHARGIKVLGQAFSEVAEVYTCAPHVERSATSHAITIHNPLRVEKLTEKIYAVEGTPADCVKLAIGQLLPYKPDFIISGINRGPNLGIDTLYSGTVSAALEGALFHIPGLAVSSTGTDRSNMHYETAAKVAVKVFKNLASKLPTGRIFNLNVPSCKMSELKGLRSANLGRRNEDDNIIESLDPRGRPYYWLGGGYGPSEPDSMADMNIIKHGYATLSILRPNLLDEDATNALKNATETLLDSFDQEVPK